MSINVSVQASGSQASVTLRGVLDSMSQATLKQQLEPVLANGAVTQIRLDFAGVQSMEAASAGMLMMLSHTAKSKNKSVGIVNANPAVLSLMHKANLGKVLQIQ
ncbi:MULTISPECIES: STAS domain-containing protein [Falsiroseomonas]|jgi:anti-anti-sigma factor|uniref:Anti-anti-sigma factor n=1 Tax=Falsiroseomonas stagni DSM 19981 TaxID=1123062 RepID=A0A1I4BSS8_9PROT|nr:MULTISPECIES: STAS domain-containing protein [Acetobacteraceae]SFK70931.1 anti-anti-sigma factor [Falsiroseomonas stagni DSM 19981]